MLLVHESQGSHLDVSVPNVGGQRSNVELLRLNQDCRWEPIRAQCCCCCSWIRKGSLVLLGQE